MTWFESLTGFKETNHRDIQEKLVVKGNSLTSRVNGQSWVCGELEMPNLAALRQLAQSKEYRTSGLSLREIVADVQSLHCAEINAGAMFQVASQFNLLEMITPQRTPEDGVGIYEFDSTQGPACAVAAGAGTIYRNYLVSVNGKIGQTQNNQIDCLADLGFLLGNTDGRLWAMQNGYALATERGLKEISKRLQESNENALDQLRGSLRIGIQWHTQVTLLGASHVVSQAYCSALPVAYSQLPSELWSDFAQLILDAAYEATFCAAIVNSALTGNNRLFLTLLGGGAFGNERTWILAAIQRAINLYAKADLDIAIVSWDSSKVDVQQLICDFNNDSMQLGKRRDEI